MRKKIFKIFTRLLILNALVFGLIACGGGGDTATGVTEPPDSPITDDTEPTDSPSTCVDDCFPNGVAAGDVDQSSVVLWARAAFTGTVRFEYGRDIDFLAPDGVEDVVVVDPVPLDNHDNPAKVDISGLFPGTQYYYRACRDSCPPAGVKGAESRGSFRTPHADGNHGLRFGVSSCFRADLKPFVSISNVPKQDLDFFVALGDTVYADNDKFLGARAKTLSKFRQKNEHGYSQLNDANDNMFALARASTAFYVDIDDHEIINNFAGGASPRSQIDTPECKRKVGENIPWGICFCDPDNDPKGNCDRQFINDTDLFKQGLQAWYEYNPVREETYGQTGDSRTAGKNKLYRYRTFGKDAALFMLDARSFRDEPIPTDPVFETAALPAKAFDSNRTMLGSKQLDDLLEDLQKAQIDGITWKFVLVPQPMQKLGNFALADRFEGYAHERAVILDYIESFCIANVVFISGDIHGTIANNLAYKTSVTGLNRYSATWDISTGPVAYDPPYGPQIIDKAPTEDLEEFQMLGPDDQNDKIKGLTNKLLIANNDPLIGLDEQIANPIYLQKANAHIPATLKQGRYDVTNTLGWTEFEIDAVSQGLTVTTYGIKWYDAPTKENNFVYTASELANILAREPFIVSQFKVTSNTQAMNGGECLVDKECTSCRCSLLAGIGNNGLGQCIARKENGSSCIGDAECISGRCTILGEGLKECRDKAPNGGFCLNDNDCQNDDCSGGFCRPSPNGQPCLLDSSCLSDRCSVTGVGLPECTAKLSISALCLNDNDCVSDNCAGFKCVAEGTACLMDANCESGRCSGFFCKTKLPNGGFCLNDNDCQNDDCSGGYCRPSPNGQPCILDSSCQSGRCSGLECKAKLPNGGSICLNPNDCQSNDCSGGYCRPSPNGQPCLLDSSCLSDRCSVTGVGLPKCKAKEPSGSSCASDGECISGNCKFGLPLGKCK